MTQRSSVPSSSLPLPHHPSAGRGGAGTIFVHVDLQALLQPAGSALVPVRLVHRASSLQHSQRRAGGSSAPTLPAPGPGPCLLRAGPGARRRARAGQGGPGRAGPGRLQHPRQRRRRRPLGEPRRTAHPSAFQPHIPAPGAGRTAAGAGRGNAGLPLPGRGTTRRRVNPWLSIARLC